MDKYKIDLKESYLLSVVSNGKTLFLNYDIKYDPWTTSPSHGNPPTFEVEKVTFELLEQPNDNIKPFKSLAGFFDAWKEDRNLGTNAFEKLLQKYNVDLNDFKVQKILGDKVTFEDINLSLMKLI